MEEPEGLKPSAQPVRLQGIARRTEHRALGPLLSGKECAIQEVGLVVEEVQEALARRR